MSPVPAPARRQRRRLSLARLPFVGRLVRQADRVQRTLESLHQVAAHECVARLLSTERQRQQGRLGRHEARVLSQSGEDGALLEIFRRIGILRRTFVEFGAGDGRGNNTTLLLQSGWSGAWLEGDPARCATVARDFARPIRDGELRLRHAVLTAENVGDELREAGVEAGVDLLSVDVDGNDYWLWRELSWLAARVVVIEYNSVYPPPVRWVMPYDPEHRWRRDTWYGASLQSFEELGAELGYALVGCTLAGTNAFFVRRELVKDFFAAPFTAENHYEPARHFLILDEGHLRHRPAAAGSQVGS